LQAGAFLLIFLLSVTHATAFKKPDLKTADTTNQETKPPAIRFSEDPVIEVDAPSFDLPFTTVGGLILVKAKIDTLEGNFVFDTGAPYLILNKTYFRNLERIHNQDDVQSGINGEGGLSEKTMVKHLLLGSFHYYKVASDLVNLGHIENLRGIKILGLLGISLFKQCEVMIDYTNSQLHLHYIKSSERKTYRNSLLQNPAAYEEHSFDFSDDRILLKTTYGKKKLQFVVDYAAESNILDSRLPAAVIDSVKIESRIALSGTDSKRAEVVKGELPGFSFGSITCDLPVVITNLENSCFASNPCINGVLGFDFLSRSRLIFNFVTRKLYVLK
jgi:hypothetical protein